MPSPALAFSHLGIFVTDLDAQARFYMRVLGMVMTDRGVLPSGELVFLTRDPLEHHQIVLCTGRGADLPTTVNQISFRVGSLDDLRALKILLESEGADDVQPIDHGTSWSVYARDPEGNRLEFFADTPWYVPQPLRKPLDLSLDDALIAAASESACRADPKFRPMSEWRVETARRISQAQRT